MSFKESLVLKSSDKNLSKFQEAKYNSCSCLVPVILVTNNYYEKFNKREKPLDSSVCNGKVFIHFLFSLKNAKEHIHGKWYFIPQDSNGSG